MLNQCILVGKVSEIDRVKSIITIVVERQHKEQDMWKEETKEEDNIDITLSRSIMKNLKDYLKINSLIGIKARIREKELRFGDSTIRTFEIVGEKITFINEQGK